MKRFFRMFTICFTLLCLCVFVGCDAGDAPGAGTESQTTDIRGEAYEYVKYPVPDGAGPFYDWIYRAYWYDNGTVTLQFSDDADGILNAVYDVQGTLIKTERESETAAVLTEAVSSAVSVTEPQVKTWRYLTDGSLLLSVTDTAENRAFLCRTDAAGNCLAVSESVPLANAVVSTMQLIVPDDDCCVWYDLHDPLSFFVAHLDENGIALSSPVVTASPVENAYRAADGCIVVWCEDGSAWRYDPTADTAAEVVLYTETDAYRAANRILYADGAVYLVGNDGITVQRDGTETLLLTFADAYLDAGEVTVLDILPGDQFLISYRDFLNGERIAGLLMPAEDRQLFCRTAVRVASYNCKPWEADLFSTAVDLFNRENKEYQIEYTEYDSIAVDRKYTNSLAQYNARAEKFKEDLIRGDAFDVLLLGSLNSTDSYMNQIEDKGILYDLSALCDEIALMDSVRTSVELNDSITVLPVTGTFSTLLTTYDTLPAGEAFTYEKLAEILAGLSEEQTLFGNDITDALRAVTLYDFVDEENGTCSFDSPVFVEFLSFLDGFKTNPRNPTANAYRNPYIGYLTGGYMNGLTVDCNYSLVGDESDPIGALLDGKMKFVTFDITDVNALRGIWYFLYEHEDEINFCGYPSKTGGSIVFENSVNVMVMKNGGETEGALAFLRTLYSDEIQNSDALRDGGLPVTESAFRACMPAGYYCYTETVRTSEHYGGPMTGKWNIGMVTTTVFADGTETAEETALYLESYPRALYLTAERANAFTDGFADATLCGLADETIESIINEELSYVTGHIRSREEAAELIQSRVSIYLAE